MPSPDKKPAKAKKTPTEKPTRSTAPEPSEEILTQFKSHFSAARREHSKADTRASADSPAHQAALQFARSHRIPGAETLLDSLLAARHPDRREPALAQLRTARPQLPITLQGHASYVEGLLLSFLKRYDEAIACYQKALDTPGFDTPGVVHNNMGRAYANKKDFDRAIACYQKALDTPGYDTPGMAHNNMGIAYRKKKDFDRAITCYQKALDTLGYDSPGMAHYNMGLAYTNKGDYDHAIACYQQALDTPGYDTPGNAHNNMGNAYANKKDFDRAIACYQQALDTPGFETPGNAHNNMGLAFAAKEDFDRAIACYQKALDTPGYDTPENAHNNMGIAYYNKGDYDHAIACYQQALDTPGFETPGVVHNNMGSAYYNKKDYDRAIACYQQALVTPGYNSPGMAHNNLALTLRDMGKYQDALAEVEKALQAPDTEGQHDRARNIKSLLEQDMAGVETTLGLEALAKAEPTQSSESIERKILKKLGELDQEKMDKYQLYLKKPISERNQIFSCLRGWSSAVTLLEGGGERNWKGGGYFLKWQGKGIIIDPGIDFVDNFHDAGYHFREVDAVLVSHDHPDHNYDLNSVDDLRYELHRRWQSLPPNEKQNLDVSKCMFVMDEDTAKRFSQARARHRGAPIHFSAADHERQRWLVRENSLPLTIQHFPVKHGFDVPNAVGLRLHLHSPQGQPDFILGYTGDTEYFEAEAGGDIKYSKGLSAELKGCDLLLAHISQPAQEELIEPAELEKRKQEGKVRSLTPEGYKKNHLGLKGLIRLINEAQPKMVLVGEFWAGLEDIRLDLIRGLRERTGSTIPILPTGLGFHLSLPDLQVDCTGCKAPTPHSKIKIAPATTPYGPLGYLCPACLA